jgi:hypothetical protein
MSSTKNIGMDVHTESISIGVRNSVGKLVMECVIETEASTIVRQRPDRLRKTTLSLGWPECRKKIGIEPTGAVFSGHSLV